MGALMLSLDIKSPDAEEFIDMKMVSGKVTGANVSVKVSDEFMEAAINGRSYIQSFGDYTKEIDASALLNKLVHNAWKSAEPGMLLWDRVLQESPARGYGDSWKETSTNPCFHPDSLVQTTEGLVKIKDMNRPYMVYSMDKNERLCIAEASPSFVTKRNAKTVKITLRNGSSIQVTPDHRLYVHDKGWVEAKDLKINDRIAHLSRNRRGKRYSGVKLTTQGVRDYVMEHRLVYEGHKKSKLEDGFDVHHKDGKTFNNVISNLEAMPHGNHSRHTAKNDNPQSHQVRGENGRFIQPETRYLPKIENVPDHLKTRLSNKFSNSVEKIEDGDKVDVYDINVKETNCLIVNNCVSHNCGEIGLCPYDSCRLLAVNLTGYVINPFTENAKIDQSMLFQHVMMAQRLMDDIVDLEVEKIDMILNKIEQDKEPDDIKQVERRLWENIKQKALEGRRTGLGYTGLGDMMAMLGIQYGSKQGTNFVSELQMLFATAAYASSIILAKERGAFDIWSYDKDQESDFIKRMFDMEQNKVITKEIIDAYKQYGRRNIGVLTIAPTGTVSLMTQTTSGIEPLFSPYYFRRRKTDDKTKSIHTDEVGDMWEEYAVVHRPFAAWYSVLKGIDFSDALDILSGMSSDELDEAFKLSPYYKATAQDVDYVEKVRLQGAAQRFVDHSISVTINMPEDVDVQTVRDVYIEAWKVGAKGVTVYRQSSRSGVLNTKKTENPADNFDYISAYKRPKTVDCDVYFRQVLKQDYIIFVGIVDGKPLEIFSIPYTVGLLPRSVSKGKITKVKSRVYKFEDSNGHVVENIVDYMTETEQNQTRDYSLMLRHRVNPKFICDSIRSYATITSFQKGILRILETYVKDAEAEKCPKCDHDMIMTEGCMKCANCGYAKCG